MIDRMLQILAWCVVGFGGLWLVTSVIGYFQRRAYNLTHAESGASKNIKPDFLKVDHEKRKSAIERGEAYAGTIAARGGASPAVESLISWSRIAATGAAIIGLIATIIGTLEKIGKIQTTVEQYSSWDQFVELVRQHQIGALVAVIVITANVIVVVKKMQKPAAE
jgi:uncharacterized membrane protein